MVVGEGNASASFPLLQNLECGSIFEIFRVAKYYFKELNIWGSRSLKPEDRNKS
jgi:hypothetical protein